MCILFCYVQQDDEKCDTGYEFILLSNRDEDFQRPTMPTHVWPQTNFVLGGEFVLLDKHTIYIGFSKGKDQLASCEGSTWLSLHTKQGKIGTLINISSAAIGQKNPNALRRGFIVPNYVNDSEIDLDRYMEQLQSSRINYMPFSFLGFERQSK
jgi:uncharacterized protein with NRDE domain